MAADGQRMPETGGSMLFEPQTQVNPQVGGGEVLPNGPQRPTVGSPGPRRAWAEGAYFLNFEDRLQPDREGTAQTQFTEVASEPTTLGAAVGDASGRVAVAKLRIEQPLGQGLGLSSAWNERSADTADSPHNFSPVSATSASQPGGMQVSDLPPVLLRLMEGIVAEEMAGLGECLSICAGRSRTLKLLGFQHLHFDARLQGFLESRASTVLRPVTDALLLIRSFLALREAARHSFLWRRLTSHQYERQKAARGLADLSREQLEQRQHRKLHASRLLGDQMEDFQRLVLSEWARAVLQAKFGCYMTRLEELSDEHEQQRVEKEVLREAHVRERLKKYSFVFEHMQDQCFAAWKAAAEESRDRERRQQRLKKSFFNATAALLESVLQSWLQQTRDNRVNRRRQEMLREQKLREVKRILRTGMQQGVEIYCIMQSWHDVMVHHRHGEQQRTRAMEAVARLANDQLSLTFSAWLGACKAQRAAEAQRFQQVQKTVMMGLQANLAAVWAAWAKGLDQRKQKQRMAQQMLASREQLLALSLNAWQQISKASKGQGHRSASVAQRAFAKTIRSSMLDMFAEWRDFTRRERLRVLKMKLSRAQGTLKNMRDLKVKTAIQQEVACMSRMLLCWRLLAAEQTAVGKERRRLARVAGLGRASAVRLHGRLVQQRTLLAWLMISKLRPIVERPGTFIVKSLQPQACLALPSPVQIYTSVEAMDEPMTTQVEVDPSSPAQDADSAAAAAAAAAWLQAESPSPNRRFRVTTSPTGRCSNERYTLACKAATSDGDYRQLLEQHRRELREQREAARRSSPERVHQWGVWAK